MGFDKRVMSCSHCSSLTQRPSPVLHVVSPISPHSDNQGSFSVSVAVPFLECHVSGTTQCVAFADGPLCPGNTPLRLLREQFYFFTRTFMLAYLTKTCWCFYWDNVKFLRRENWHLNDAESFPRIRFLFVFLFVESIFKCLKFLSHRCCTFLKFITKNLTSFITVINVGFPLPAQLLTSHCLCVCVWRLWTWTWELWFWQNFDCGAGEKARCQASFVLTDWKPWACDVSSLPLTPVFSLSKQEAG